MPPRLTRVQKLILQKLDHAHDGCAYFNPKRMNSLLALQYHGLVGYAGIVFELLAITERGRDFVRFHIRKLADWRELEAI